MLELYGAIASAHPVTTSGTVTLRGPDGTYSVHVKKSGSFVIRVPPGSYVVTGQSPRDSRCPGGKIKARAHERQHVRIQCSLV